MPLVTTRANAASIGYLNSRKKPLSYMWILAGVGGELYTSTSTTAANGSWTSRTSSFGSSSIFAVASNRYMFVAVGADGKLATSTDGITWTQRTSSFSAGDGINGVAYGDGYWVAVGDNAKIAYSTDGVTWTQKNTGISGTVVEVAWGNGVWVISNATGSFYTATDPTATWTSRTSTLSAVSSILFCKSQSIWVAGYDTGTTGALASSTDGTTWTARTSAHTIAGSGTFAATNSVIASIATDASFSWDIQSSTNGTTWTNRTPAVSSGIITFGASDDAGLILFSGMQTSTNGSTWSSRTSVSSNIITACHSSGLPSLQ